MSDFEEEDGHPISKKDIKESIKKHKLYSTPSLNEVLYLHYLGFTKIQNLEPFINLKALWLNNNAITKIEGLDELTNLTCLYLANNLIDEISGLDKLEKLDTLVLSSNYISKIEGLSGCKNLTTLSIDHNRIKEAENLIGLTEAPTLTILNMNDNQIKDEQFAEIIRPLTLLRVLRMNGNEVTRNMKNYRRRITLEFEDLKFLDDAPVTDEDRRLALAWSKGGIQEERKERDLIKKEKEEKHTENMKKFHELVNEGKRKYEQAKKDQESQATTQNHSEHPNAEAKLEEQNEVKTEQKEVKTEEQIDNVEGENEVNHEDDSFFITKQTKDTIETPQNNNNEEKEPTEAEQEERTDDVANDIHQDQIFEQIPDEANDDDID